MKLDVKLVGHCSWEVLGQTDTLQWERDHAAALREKAAARKLLKLATQEGTTRRTKTKSTDASKAAKRPRHGDVGSSDHPVRKVHVFGELSATQALEFGQCWVLVWG